MAADASQLPRRIIKVRVLPTGASPASRARAEASVPARAPCRPQETQKLLSEPGGAGVGLAAASTGARKASPELALAPPYPRSARH
jgi:hypothetical protein